MTEMPHTDIKLVYFTIPVHHFLQLFTTYITLNVIRVCVCESMLRCKLPYIVHVDILLVSIATIKM